MVPLVASSCLSVPSGFELFGDNTYYKYVSPGAGRRHGTAKTNCEDYGGHLAYMRNSLEENAILHYATGTEPR